jgi:hypothetical protein
MESILQKLPQGLTGLSAQEVPVSQNKVAAVQKAAKKAAETKPAKSAVKSAKKSKKN